jgi:hypothetical protein
MECNGVAQPRRLGEVGRTILTSRENAELRLDREFFEKVLMMRRHHSVE